MNETVGFKFPKKRLAALIYSGAGTGKTITAMTACLVKGLKVRVLAIEANAMQGIEEAIAIHNIQLEEGQLIVAVPDNDSAATAADFMNQETDAYYQSIISRILNFKGYDIATGKEVNLGKVMSWKLDSCFILDGMTMFENSCAARGRKKAKDAGTAKDARAAFYAGQDALVGGIFQVIEQSGCHCIVLAHQAMSDQEQMNKHKLVKSINPGFGTRSVIDKLAGRFTIILYQRYNQQKRQYVLSAEEADAYTISRGIDRNKLKQFNIDLRNLPANFSHEIYANYF